MTDHKGYISTTINGLKEYWENFIKNDIENANTEIDKLTEYIQKRYTDLDIVLLNCNKNE